MLFSSAVCVLESKLAAVMLVIVNCSVAVEYIVLFHSAGARVTFWYLAWVSDTGARAGTSAAAAGTGATAGAASAGVGTPAATAVDGVGATPGLLAVPFEFELPAVPATRAAGLGADALEAADVAGVGVAAFEVLASGAGTGTGTPFTVATAGAGTGAASAGAGAGTPAVRHSCKCSTRNWVCLAPGLYHRRTGKSSRGELCQLHRAQGLQQKHSRP